MSTYICLSLDAASNANGSLCFSQRAWLFLYYNVSILETLSALIGALIAERYTDFHPFAMGLCLVSMPQPALAICLPFTPCKPRLVQGGTTVRHSSHMLRAPWIHRLQLIASLLTFGQLSRRSRSVSPFCLSENCSQMTLQAFNGLISRVWARKAYLRQSLSSLQRRHFEPW